MNKKPYSADYIHHYQQGPFPGQIDPWAEAAHYFQQIHSGMIGQLLDQIREPLLQMGYVAGREAGLQIAEGREPDIYIKDRQSETDQQTPQWDYDTAALEVLAEPGIAVEADGVDALHIKSAGDGRLVTVVEIISPGNKTRPHLISAYQERRSRLVSGQGVNVVEIDPTRSVKRLFEHLLTQTAAYHIAIYLPDENPRVLPVKLAEPLKRIALPLSAEVLPLELQHAYDAAYQQASIAPQLTLDHNYTLTALPFPSLLSEHERQHLSAQVTDWQTKLNQLKTEE